MEHTVLPTGTRLHMDPRVMDSDRATYIPGVQAHCRSGGVQKDSRKSWPISHMVMYSSRVPFLGVSLIGWDVGATKVVLSPTLGPAAPNATSTNFVTTNSWMMHGYHFD